LKKLFKIICKPLFMFSFHAFLILGLELTAGYPKFIDWKLAFNINAADGHNFGYEADAWEDDSNVGTDDKAFHADYKSYNATTEIANFIAIVRHQNGVCDIARVWQFKLKGQTLRDYIDSKKSLRSTPTYDNYNFTASSPTFVHKDTDPIFGIDGGLTFNWVYSDNGVRIGNSKTYCKGGLPSKTINDDSYHGLGNEFWLKSNTGKFWFDSGVHQECCWAGGCKVQGSDHGTSLKNGELYGQYAIYVSDVATTFSCNSQDLQISILDLGIEFAHFDRGETGYISFDEFVFEMSDDNDDGVLSLLEYAEARAHKDFGDTATVGNVMTDFNRIDRDGDQYLTFNEVLFDIVDTDKNGMISSEEYSQARIDNTLPNAN